MEQVLGLFHDMRHVQRVTAELQRSGRPFNRIIIMADMGEEDELRPEVTLTRAVLKAAARVEGDIKAAAQSPADGPQEGAANNSREEPAAGSSATAAASPGDFQQKLAEKGLQGHQVDNFLKHIFSGHMLVVFTFSAVADAKRAVPLLERMGALRTEHVSAAKQLKTGQSGGTA